jgi:UV DNA damage endonuclease
MDYKPRMGYCCLCLSLEGEGVTTNRGMVKRTFLEKGLSYVSDLALRNVRDLMRIIKFNGEAGIRMYRMSSDMFPWCSEYEIKDLPDFEEIAVTLKLAGDLSKVLDQRLSFHPSPYCVIASERGDVVQKSIKELNQHAEIMDLMGLDRSHEYPINIHINTTKPTKQEAAERFVEVYKKLSPSVKSRLVLENDDKKSQFTPTDLFEMVHKKIGIPLTYDFLHHTCNPDGLKTEEALDLCISTWPQGVVALTHFSDSRKIFEDSSSKEVAHSDWIWSNIETYDRIFDIELEVKMKDLALLKYIEKCQKSLI